MSTTHVHAIAAELGLPTVGVGATVRLLDEGATVPFISRYRKEATGSLDEVAVAAIRDRREQLADLDKRRTAILKSLDERGLLSPELRAAVAGADTMAVLEDIYLPHRPKRRTRATMARERGLGPLADWLREAALLPPGQATHDDPAARAAEFVDPENEVPTVEDALAGARDIVAEAVNEDAEARARLRRLFRDQAEVSSKVIKGQEEAGAKFRDWFEWAEPVRRIAGHRTLALRRGEKEKVLTMRIALPEETALRVLEPRFVANQSPSAREVRQAVADGWKRLLSVALETECRMDLKQEADVEAIGVFAANLRELLLAAPLGRCTVLALDPGFRTGCKLVVLDAQGGLMHHDAVYPHTGGDRVAQAGRTVTSLVKKCGVQAIAVGNGTAGRETERWLGGLGLPSEVPVVMVNESGASVYSASDTARAEFPDHDVTVRGAVSIGRRLMDPLAELVKIDPKSIGVGQYQHDVEQRALKRSLDDTVTSCVNNVGVDLNTASGALLTYVSGLGPQLAQNIVDFRAENGPFTGRRQLLKVARLGEKAFEQAAGFLRIPEGKQPLDASAVHPERYKLVERMAGDLGCAVAELVGDAERTSRLRLDDYVDEDPQKGVGRPTLEDILAELAKPGRDPRDPFEAFSFADGVEKMEDLQEGMRLPGIVTNVTNFGAFIDVGVHQDGLAHISQLADRFVRDPSEVVKAGQKVMARVLEVDLARGRISLSLKES